MTSRTIARRWPLATAVAACATVLSLRAQTPAATTEIVAGQRGGERSLIMYTPSANGEAWTRRVLDQGGMAGAGCAAVDLNADKRTDASASDRRRRT